MPKPIPRAKLRDGSVVCLSVASLRLEETDTALGAGLLTQAGIVFTFAGEEFGKAVLLREAFETGQDHPVLIDGFIDHHKKIAAAGKHVPARFLRLIAGAFDPEAFDSGGFDTGLEADVDARWSGLHVDWDGRSGLGDSGWSRRRWNVVAADFRKQSRRQ
jgi:hypothetical protein